MLTLLLWIGRLGLAFTILPAVLFFAGTLTLSATKLVMLVGMVLWFVTAPINQRVN
ncbi:hypothetical protein N9V86_04060 [Opitutales bacterium]|nr:hypothetical protein [Opitutales bacterium]